MTSTRKTVVITGASAGVGRETARVFAQHGYNVALVARGTAGLAAAAKEVENLGRRCLTLNVDVADFAQVDHAATRVEQEFGSIDVWVNNAMTTVFSPLTDVKPDDFQRAIEVTFLGQVWGTMAALARMQPHDEGTIINVGSALAFIGIPLQSAYCASKFACRGFFEATRAELLHDRSKVRLCMVHLPAMNTPQFDWCETTMDRHPQPVAPIYQPEIAAAAIFASATDGKRARIVGSWNKALVLMDSFFPGLGNHYASLAAWNSQLTKEAVAPDRPSNLRHPADDDRDYGGHGIFDDRARGVRDPSFLRSLPKVVVLYLMASQRTLREHRAVKRRARQPQNAEHDPVRDDLQGPPQNPAVSPEVTSLDVLENENARLLTLFDGMNMRRGSAVQDRYEYGNLAKECLRHLAVRLSSLTDVAAALSDSSALRLLGERMVLSASTCELLVDGVTKMARGVHAVDLNESQDFDGPMTELIEAVRTEIEWETSSAIPSIRQSIAAHQFAPHFRSSRYVRHHAPTYVSTKGPRWRDHAPVVSRWRTMYEHLNDHPRASREWRSS